ncbi:undecaprenyl/decaprenyl-phosphate alpha-N-acetylglucosaminyl 1-phosphate transferase [bacterium]|nr:undecaprenyl/decaprenyl-phosphate alpha-N-acetylglucosaminyl 1-phosphate transferase [bacterium]
MNVYGMIAFLLSVAATAVVRRLANRFGVVDNPTGGRKIHAKPIPLLGGIGIFVAIAAVTLGLLAWTPLLTGGDITPRHYVGFLLGGLVLMVGGYLDDRYNLPAKLAIIAPIAAALVAVASGMNVSKITNPFGGVILIEHWPSNVIVFAWLLVVMYTTKFMDGLDGLATGVSSIGTLMVMLLSLTVAYFQPDVATFASVCLGALLGFLVFNFNPASIFLGEGGSTFVGFTLGTLAVISGGKLATALLVIAIPLMDVVWIIVRRFRAGGVAQIFKADRKHLHHRLLDRGWSQRRIVFSYYLVAVAFGLSALFLQSKQKLIALAALAAAMVVFAMWMTRQERNV